MTSKAPPVIDFGAFYGTDQDAKQDLIARVRHACQDHGFFQLINHGVSPELQRAILEQSEDFFAQPCQPSKDYSNTNEDIGGVNRGYERLRAQNFEKRTKGDLKEGYYFGTNLAEDHPHVLTKRINSGPNKYPVEVSDPNLFRTTIDGYFDAVLALAGDILQVLAAGLDLEEDWFTDLCDTPIAILRLLHYPPQEPQTTDLERGVGAHTDFGAITILLQDLTGGLQVWNREDSEWVDVTPVPGAFVVNLGNLMMRWTNDKYLSNLHRVINTSGRERYSVPFFLSGNPNFIVRCLESCEDETLGAKYPPISVHDWLTGRYADTYGQSKEKAMADLCTASLGGVGATV
ncbi:hypothetical protein BDV26DRAFT_293082 [Aspergillus bertholletiae]|uniref:Fe2OG dioxygenase domain-containing protein n=1 Tax=Aspergillus bertholletiae TaxID=1226010 RepID=A0A5N7B796_9EURO|nr:hypothetical protein BDV26DRAFT_293082 [Aspergillus bertholletiae]